MPVDTPERCKSLHGNDFASEVVPRHKVDDTRDSIQVRSCRHPRQSRPARPAFACLPRDVSGDLRRALRLLWRRPGFTAAAVITLAFGAGIMTAVVSIAEALLVRPLPYPNADRIAYIRELDRTGQGPNLSWSDFYELGSSLRSFAAIGACSDGSRTLQTGAGPPERVRAIEITPTFLNVFGVRPSLGRAFSDADAVRGAPAVIILSHAAWRGRFGGDPAAIGRAVVVSGTLSTIVGVLPPWFVFASRANPEVWLPLRPTQTQLTRADMHVLECFRFAAPA